ncbi:hypothetical protein [Mucilaginibacter sp.]|uniref:hypothetical protein n=1 Tax=Mucilaginibacter sp. TaxID=1882438 RepID=UPI002ED63FE3
MSGVIIGLIIYLSHLVRQTIEAVSKLINQNEFDFMAPFFSIPYFILLYEIYEAVFKSSLANLANSESKMITVLLYPFFVLLAELIVKLKDSKE